MLLYVAVNEEGGQVVTIKVRRSHEIGLPVLKRCVARLCVFVIDVYVIRSLFVAIVFHDLAWSLLHRRVGCAITRNETV